MRRELDRRPAVVFFLALCLGIGSLTGNLLLACLLPAVLLLPSRQARGAAMLGFLAGLALNTTHGRELTEPGLYRGILTVASPPRRSLYGESFEVSDGRHRFMASTDGRIATAVGDSWQVVTIERPYAHSTPKYLHADRGSGRLRLNLGQCRLRRRGPFLWKVANDFRRSFDRFCDRALPGPARSWTEAIAFRAQTIDAEDREALMRVGASHIVAASGLHVFVLAGLMTFLLGLLPVPRLIVIAIVAFGLTLYAMATGLQPATVRAVAMTVLYLGAWRLGREPDGLSALALASVGYLCWDPLALYLLGFQLSVIVVAALLLFPPPHLPKARTAFSLFGSQCFRLCWASLLASVVSSCVLAYHVGEVTWCSLPSGVLVMPFACLVLVISFVAFALSGLVPEVGQGLMTLFVDPSVGWIRAVDRALDMPGATLRFPAFGAFWMVCGLALALLLWRRRVVPADAP